MVTEILGISTSPRVFILDSNKRMFHYNRNTRNINKPPCVYSSDLASEQVTLDVTALAEANGDIDLQERRSSSQKSLAVIYDSDEEPPSPPRRGSVTLSYSSTRNKGGENNGRVTKKRKSQLFCCMARNISKRHLPTP